MKFGMRSALAGGAYGYRLQILENARPAIQGGVGMTASGNRARLGQSMRMTAAIGLLGFYYYEVSKRNAE